MFPSVEWYEISIDHEGKFASGTLLKTVIYRDQEL